MLQRNLIYTAITRSKQSLILCGEEDALRMGVERADESKRQTTLCEKLRETISGNDFSLASKASESEMSLEEELMLVSPMVGMENVTPYDFMVKD
jgi:exodeoxyribonuclease V alpha subunit